MNFSEGIRRDRKNLRFFLRHKDLNRMQHSDSTNDATYLQRRHRRFCRYSYQQDQQPSLEMSLARDKFPPTKIKLNSIYAALRKVLFLF